ncbi:TetR/AcrR family transcriptional regulator [Kocuria tytonis]|uniref:TetR/AcrR family transcriptional regulator n=1 Tax=Kocuria tytonis TaxID=2054280 RepID=A0A495A6C7_9MICC|nr:TetR/AcrR family transcriptional regulator [Kocuria tytonis]RKQ35085.1 TetR/AcrR family transcriptional regulator [Kocuria tytonis]
MDAAATDPPRTTSLDVRVAHTLTAVRTACLELLEVQNARDITISQLCKKAAISRPTFYQHYAGLDDVYADIVRQELSRTAHELESFDRTPGQNPLERLLSFVHAHGVGALATVGNRQLASRARPIVELWLAERVARAAFDADLDDLDAPLRTQTYFAAGGLVTVLTQQAKASSGDGASTEDMAHILRSVMRAVLRAEH